MKNQERHTEAVTTYKTAERALAASSLIDEALALASNEQKIEAAIVTASGENEIVMTFHVDLEYDWHSNASTESAALTTLAAVTRYAAAKIALLEAQLKGARS